MSILSRLYAYIARLFLQQNTQRAIALQPAKRPLRVLEEPPTIILQSALSAVKNYQTASNEGRRAIVVQLVNLQQPSDASGVANVLPLNRGAARAMFDNEYAHQVKLYRMSKGRLPFYHYEWAGVTQSTYAAIGQEAAALLKGEA